MEEEDFVKDRHGNYKCNKDGKRQAKLHYIDETHPQYDPLTYVLLHPQGSYGWAPNTYYTKKGLEFYTKNNLETSDEDNNAYFDITDSEDIEKTLERVDEIDRYLQPSCNDMDWCEDDLYQDIRFGASDFVIHSDDVEIIHNENNKRGNRKRKGNKTREKNKKNSKKQETGKDKKKSKKKKKGKSKKKKVNKKPKVTKKKSKAKRKTKEDKNFVGCRKYYKYRAMVRTEKDKKLSNPLHHYGKLWQQYLVDAWAKTQHNDLNYLTYNQENIRRAHADGLRDAIKNNEVEGSGNPTILPASFIGSPRWFNEKYQDAMAIVHKYKKPDLFITFTCNPKWKEIRENLFNNQTAYDRPDIVARVFNMKRKQLLKDLINDYVFGKCIAHCETIEFQKRGLPHLHLLIILSKTDALKTTAHYDKVVSAEIPDRKKSPRLFEAVMNHMIHHHTEFCYTKTAYCSKLFPKQYCSATTQQEDGYPVYRRLSPEQVCFIAKGFCFSVSYMCMFIHCL